MMYEKVILDNPKYKIIEKCNQGYEPYFELFVRKKFLFLSWWSLSAWSLNMATIYDFMNKHMGNKHD